MDAALAPEGMQVAQDTFSQGLNRLRKKACFQANCTKKHTAGAKARVAFCCTDVRAKALTYQSCPKKKLARIAVKFVGTNKGPCLKALSHSSIQFRGLKATAPSDVSPSVGQPSRWTTDTKPVLDRSRLTPLPSPAQRIPDRKST